uniref:DUF1068 domain-containing protein n=1 Tax=Araucaria cunninghamii TaxID=56994 RepID=A0A0D6R110_ARACU
MAQKGLNSCSPGTLKLVMVLLAMSLALYIVGPPLYWHLAEGLASARHASAFSCPACVCDCPPDSLVTIPSGLGNASFADCGKHDPEVSEEMEKNYADLLAEELKLQESVAAEAQQRADMALLEAKKLASQYQKEAEKCNAGMETCEEAREKAEATLIAEKKLSSLWERRARQMGWKEEMAQDENSQSGNVLQARNGVETKTVTI